MDDKPIWVAADTHRLVKILAAKLRVSMRDVVYRAINLLTALAEGKEEEIEEE